MSALAVLLLAHSALAGSSRPPQPPPPRVQQPVAPLRASAPPHRSHPVQNGAHGAHLPAGVIAAPIVQHAPTPPSPQAANRGHHHHQHHQRFVGQPCQLGGTCDGYVDEAPLDGSDTNPSDAEAWDDPVDESVPGFDEPAAAMSPEPAAPVDCDGGATDFQVDDGNGGPAFYRWVDRDGSINYTDEASVPDRARATAKRTSGDPITIAPRGACQGAARPRN